MAEIIEIRSFKSGKKYRYYIKNIQSLSIQLASPATSMALPLAGDASNILTKAEGNTLRVTISWVIHDETSNVVEPNNFDDELPLLVLFLLFDLNDRSKVRYLEYFCIIFSNLVNLCEELLQEL